MRKWLARGGFALLALVLAVLVGLMVWEPLAADRGTPPPKGTYQAEIIRDEFGVPHIYGKTDADVAYGVAIAHSEDDFSTLQDVAAMTRGRYGAIAGEDGAQVDYLYHLLDARGTAQRNYASVPADTRALFEAYAAGMNDFATQNPGEVKLDRLFPLDGEDIATGFALRQPLFFGLGNTIGPLVAGEKLNREQGPPIPQKSPNIDEPAPESVRPAPPIAHTQASGRTRPLPLHAGENAAFAGSNAFAIAPEKSGDGVTRLVSNSHQPWRGGVAWYELVVESGEGWHYAGANFPGSPFPFLGHNEHLGWTNTVNQPDMVDVYRLEMSDDGSQYRLDGEWRDLETRTVTLPVRFGPVVLPVRRDILRSVHGPVIANDNGHFAIRYGGMDSLGALDAYYRMNKATSFAEWEAILARLDVPSTNFIYADEAGNIGYYYNAAIPDRPATIAGKRPDWRGILPGNDSALIWNGTVDFEALPQVVNPASGWVFNANNRPDNAAGPGSDVTFTDFAPEMGIELRDTNRARRAARLMAEADVIDRETLERIKYDTGYDRSGYVADMLDAVAALDLKDGSRLAQAQALLNGWDLFADNVGRGDALALLMIRPYMGADYQNGTIPDVREELQRSADHLMEHFGRLDPPMSKLLRLRQGSGDNRVDLPLDGGSDTLRASTLWDVDDDGRLSVRHGDSFIQFVEWKDGELLKSESIQPYGAATTRPNSLHYADQASLFVQHKLKPVRFYRADVLKNAVSRKIVRHR
ncbi:Acyl-homoserine-lactone acylase [Alteripontixanthobacter maritimus]|uniref:Acyl-homoserine-lactone acylase n=1 Tax=Alteripontixanthobacter maritimus TaxID=2161824 RepID=A0A369Q8M5_9SPHN|nr:acylase [Alteripontixanthobacter maritimus]RDC59279.1 Acyl-homoserine-lactone acylase [Alteripontixanthobacter maritimus]